MTRYFAVILALTLGGCTATSMVADKNWSKAGSSPADLTKAKAECEFEAAKSDVPVLQTTWVTELQQARLMDLCLKSKGYSRD